MKLESLVPMIYEANRAYCASLEDYSHVPWELTQPWVADSIVAGILDVLKNPERTPSQIHDSWLAHKTATGWSYAPEKDAANRMHPNMVAFTDLPDSERHKDVLFLALVKAFADVLEYDTTADGQVVFNVT